MNALGTNANFEHTVMTEIDRARIWELWVEPATWGTWDGGLRSASSGGGRLWEGSLGQIVPLSGPPSEFRVMDMREGEGYSFATTLPLAKLTVSRFFVEGGITHRVRFEGVLGWLWAAAFGPGFRRELPLTMQRLIEKASL